MKGAEFDLYGPYTDEEIDVNGFNPQQTAKKLNQNAIITGDGGTVKIGDLQTGIYYLYETKAPDGYLKFIEPVKITVDSRNEATCPVSYEQKLEGQTTNLSSNGGITVTEEDDVATYVLTVLNTAGARLPATGGEGTTLYYALGTLLVLAAVALMIARRRAQAEE